MEDKNFNQDETVNTVFCVEIRFGALSNINDELAKNGFRFKDEEAKEKWEKLTLSRTILRVNGFITDAESEKIISRFIKKLPYDVEPMTEEAYHPTKEVDS